jgi:adenylate cyclase
VKKILVVEDVEFNRDLLVQLLEDEYEVLTAVDGAAGIEMTERDRPDLGLMDLSLPVVDGWEATRRIKASPDLKTIPVIALTAHAMQGDEEKARASGCDDYLSKPIDETQLLEKIRALLAEGRPGHAGQNEAGTVKRAMDKRPRVLIVDDEPYNVDLLEQELELLDCDTVSAQDGRKALQALEAQPIDLVLLDIVMPKLDGISVLRQIKSDPDLRAIPVIMISASSDLDSIVRCIELGAEDYLPKPFERVVLHARVGACLDRKRLHDQEIAHLKQIQEQLVEINVQRRRADDLLHVIMPAGAVAELKATDRVTPRRYDRVTVIFTDIVNFTAYCDGHEPEDVVSNLQFLVEACEAVSAAQGLEKIKTVGDAFMATAGLLIPHADPVMAGVRGAFAMAEAARHVPAGWLLRVGIHVGPVVAGIVGRSKLSYDLWGDTVNVAARLSQFGSDAAVLLSVDAWAFVKDRCHGRSLGLVAIKGKGAIEVVECLGQIG